MSNSDKEPGTTLPPTVQYMDPIEFRVMPEILDANRPLLQSDYIGDQLAENPAETLFLETKQGGRFLTKAQYLKHELRYIVGIKHNDDLPERARKYFEQSDSFKAIFENRDEANEEEILARTERFILEHGKYCRERLDAIQEQVARYRDEFNKKVREAVKNGDLPDQAATNLAMLDHVSFSVTDAITSLNNPDGILGGYYSAATQNIGVSIFLPEEEVKSVIFHEAMHAISGHTIVKKFGVFTEHKRVGFPKQDSEEWANWLNEAITEHLASSLLRGRFDLILPEERYDAGIYEEETEAYYHERQMLGLMVHPEVSTLTLNDFLQVYFAHRKDGDTAYIAALRNLVRKDRKEFLSLSKRLKVTNAMVNRWEKGESFADILGVETDEI